MAGWIVDSLRNGQMTSVEKENMERCLSEWRVAVLAAVSTMQFRGVEEFGRQMGLDPEDLDPLPLSAARQAATYMDGKIEIADVQALRAPVQAFPRPEADVAEADVSVPWRDDLPRGPSRKRPHACLQAQEPHYPNPCSQQPRWRRLPRYMVDSISGEARTVGLPMGKEVEARIFAKVFCADARRNFAKSHMHRCMPTCFQHRGGGKTGDRIRICRFGHYYGREVAAFPRRWPKKLKRCRNHDCPRKRDGDRLWVIHPKTGRLQCVDAHPWHCAASAAVPGDKDVRRFFSERQGVGSSKAEPYAWCACVSSCRGSYRSFSHYSCW